MKLEWMLLLNINYDCDLGNSHSLFSIPVAEYASFSHQAWMLRTNPDLVSSWSIWRQSLAIHEKYFDHEQ